MYRRRRSLQSASGVAAVCCVGSIQFVKVLLPPEPQPLFTQQFYGLCKGTFDNGSANGEQMQIWIIGTTLCYTCFDNNMFDFL